MRRFSKCLSLVTLVIATAGCRIGRVPNGKHSPIPTNASAAYNMDLTPDKGESFHE